MENRIVKYPRTPHIEGSRLQTGDEDISQIQFSTIAGLHVVVEEKVDGANVGISFSDGELYLQSRGHFLRGGAKEKEYELFKLWAVTHREELYTLLGDRYIMYGEWLYAKHKVYYNALPHYFLEFDIFDKECGVYLDTGRRMEILDGSTVKSVPVLFDGVLTSREQLLAMIKRSNYIKGDHLSELAKKAEERGLDRMRVLAETDPSDLMEGLYIKVEDGGEVKARMKYVRHGYTQAAAVEKWHGHTIIENELESGDIFA